MAAPFTRGHCPGCQETTKHRYLFFANAADGEEELWSICEACFTVFTEREDGSFVQRPATDAERARVPPPVVWSEQERAWWQETLRQGRADLRAWVQSGCPGLTPELERAMWPGTLDRLRRFVELPDNEVGPESHS
jgi:hypothetical protein